MKILARSLVWVSLAAGVLLVSSCCTSCMFGS